ncbi:dihydroxy-acid dehydratase [Salipiger aestuarii]|uniref:dihydroxy-acid dehydratase n=1 Tax=Salipiger aestuarii TaxID=568098 RepID=UPI00123AF8F6|nr:dihydroxy-acid dehydratase [Salipiger aestuarii]KAA8608054.1 dihydroxy-acid dehydratase [Salipiger aestuarii]KAA8611447.1 dihydroxy-acid dehydratase [Salipiger aestuarii]
MTRLRKAVLCSAAVVVAGALAGCLSAPPDGAPDTARLAGGDVVIGGPRGYCVDPGTFARGPARTFAVIASCRKIAGGDDGPVVAPMLVTVTVGAPDTGAALPEAPALAAEMGQRMIGGLHRNGLTLTHLAGGGTDVLDDGDPRYWRGTFVQGGRMVGLALYAPRDSPLAGSDGAAMLHAIRDRIATLSPQGG